MSEVRRRQLVLAGGLVLLLIVVVLGIHSCTTSAKKRGLRDYATNISNVIRKSDSDVSTPLFRLLSGAGATQASSGNDLQNQINNLKVEADNELSRAEALDVPSQVDDAQRFVLLTLELRRDGVQKIAEKLQEVRGNAGESAVRAIAGQMRAFDASDVMWSQRVIPLVEQAQRDAGVSPVDAPVARSSFLKDSAWLDPTFVADRLGSATAGGTGGPVAPGTHGHGLESVAVGSTALDTAAVNRIPASPAPIFVVKFINQGENDEQNVRVRVEVEGQAPVVRTVANSPKGQESTVSVALSKPPPVTGSVTKVKVTVVPVPGEKTTENNTQTYQVLFTR